MDGGEAPEASDRGQVNINEYGPDLDRLSAGAFTLVQRAKKLEVQVIKYSAAGNDFLLLEQQPLVEAQVRRLCDRRFGVGADGVILYRWITQDKIAMQLFNADGSAAAMCGNGARCLAHFAREQKGLDSLTIIAKAGSYPAKVQEERVALRFPLPAAPKEVAPQVFFVDTGVPHLVIVAENAGKFQESHWSVEGRSWRCDPRAGPEGANANLVYIDSKGVLHLRTLERGIEEETYACGTGAVAAAVVLRGQKQEISILTHSQALIRVLFEEEALWTEGPVKVIFQGTIVL